MKNTIPYIIIIAILGGLFSSNAQEPEVDRIGIAIQEKIQKLKKEKWLDCQRVAIEKAEAYVDSIIAYEVTQRQIQSKGVPPRPTRPAWNAVDSLAPLDMELVPILEDPER